MCSRSRLRARPPTCRRPGPGGFTLLELLISLALLSAVLTLVYGAFAQISGSATRLQDELTERQELRLLVRMISDELASAQWLEHAAGKSRPIRTGIVGETRFVEGDEFSFVSFHAARPTRFHRTVDPAADPGLHEVGYAVERSEEGEALLLVRREDYYIDEDLEAGGLEVVLAEDVETFLVEYLAPGADPNALETPWELRWNSPENAEQARMPVAVRLTVGLTDSAGNTLAETVEFNLPGSLEL